LARKTTIILDDDIYVKLVNMSIRKYGSARHISKIINNLLRKVLEEKKDEDILSELEELLSGPKLAKVTPKEFEEFRRELSKRLES